MSSFSVELDRERPCRYVFASKLWDNQRKKFGNIVNVLLDTGSFNTIVHYELVPNHGVMLERSMNVSVGGFNGEANLCILSKLQIGGHILEKVVALAMPFKGELQDHIILGANVLNNWKFTLSQLERRLEVTEQFSNAALQRTYPYRYCFNNSGQVMALQELDD